MDVIEPCDLPEKNRGMLKLGAWALSAAAVFLVLWALFLPADWEARFGIFGAPIRLAARLPMIRSLAEAAALPAGVMTGVLGLQAWLTPFFGLYCVRWLAFARSSSGELRLVLYGSPNMSPILWIILWPVMAFGVLGFPWWWTNTPEHWRAVGGMINAMLDDRLWLGLWGGAWGLFILSLLWLPTLYCPLAIWARLAGKKPLAEERLTPEERRTRRRHLARSMPTKALRRSLQESYDTLDRLERQGRALEALTRRLRKDPKAMEALDAALKAAEEHGGREAVDAPVASYLGLSKEERQNLNRAGSS